MLTGFAADRLSQLDSNGTVFSEYTALAKKHESANLGQGFPSLPVHSFIRDALVKTAHDSCMLHQYTKSEGHPRLVNALANFYSPQLDRKIDPQTEILTTVGASEAIYIAVQSLVGPGDEVLIIEPFFDCYPAAVRLAGGVPVFVALQVQPGDSQKPVTSSAWQLDFENLESKITSKTKMVILNNPSNPIGKVWTRNELEQMAAIADKKDILVMADEVYENLCFSDSPSPMIKFASLPKMFERTITLGSMGKMFGVTGWKVGWIIADKGVTRAAWLVHQYLPFSVATPLQEAGAIALETAMTNGYFEKTRLDYQKRRDKVMDLLTNVDLVPTKPDAGYFIIAKIPTNNNSKDMEYSKFLTINAGVTPIPLRAFYDSVTKESQMYVRFAFCKDDALLDLAKEREKFAKYFKSQDIEISDKISITLNETIKKKKYFKVFSSACIEKDEIIAKVPKKNILSIKTSVVADIIEKEELFGLLGLGLALMFELASGENSPWFDYFQLIDTMPDLPIFWSNVDKNLLKGTDIGLTMENDLKMLKFDYNEYILPLLNRYPILKKYKDLLDFELWLRACALISSRAFQVDAYHGSAIVPFADLLDHSVTENVHFEGVEVCEYCGLLEGTCGCEMSESHNHDEAEWVDEGSDSDDATDSSNNQQAISNEEDTLIQGDSESEEDDDDNVPLLVQAHKLPTIHEDIPWDPSQGMTEGKEMQIDMLDDDDGQCEFVTMVAIRDIPAGEEVFNTYGEHSSSVFLRMYGFVIEENPAREVTITIESVTKLITEAAKTTTKEKVGNAKKGKGKAKAKAKNPVAENYAERVEFWNTLAREVCWELQNVQEEDEENEENECGEGCHHDHHDHHDENEKECGDDCGHQHGQEEEEDFDGEGEEEDKDDFCFTASGAPSFQLYVFLHLVLLPKEFFDGMVEDLMTMLDFIVGLRNELTGAQEIQDEGVGKDLTKSVKQILKDLVVERRKEYPTPDEWQALSSVEGLDPENLDSAEILQKQEKDVLTNAQKWVQI